MANALYVTNSVAQAMATAIATAADAGTAAVINIYGGTAPADADASEANTLLAQLTCAATCFTGPTDASPGARLTFGTITADSSADNTGTATHWRLLTQSGGTVVIQGTCGTSGCDMNLSSTSVVQGATVSITAGTITVPEGP